MTNKTIATDDQLTQIRLRAVNDVTREIMSTGIRLTHEQSDALGEEAIEWIGVRLGLNVQETDTGVECTPPKHYSGEAARAAGIESDDEA